MLHCITLLHCVTPYIQPVSEDFSIKDYVLKLLEESGKVELRPKNMDTDDFLKYGIEII